VCSSDLQNYYFITSTTSGTITFASVAAKFY